MQKGDSVWVIPEKAVAKVHRIDGDDIYVVLNGIRLFALNQLVDYPQDIAEEQTPELYKASYKDYVSWMFARLNHHKLLEAELIYNQTKTWCDPEWRFLSDLDKVDFADVDPPISDAHSDQVMRVLGIKHKQFVKLNSGNEVINL